MESTQKLLLFSYEDMMSFADFILDCNEACQYCNSQIDELYTMWIDQEMRRKYSDA